MMVIWSFLAAMLKVSSLQAKPSELPGEFFEDLTGYTFPTISDFTATTPSFQGLAFKPTIRLSKYGFATKETPSQKQDDFSNGGRCKRIVCYATNNAHFAPGGRFLPKNMEPTFCTHIIYAFAGLNGNRLVAVSRDDETSPGIAGMYGGITQLKHRNPALKVLLAVGGWTLGSRPFTRMVANYSNRQEFIDTSIQFLRQRNFDGLDIDWEYPSKRGSPLGDRDKFSLLLKETKEAFEREATGSTRLLLTAAVSAAKSTIDSTYDIPEIAKYLDFANLMTYDFHGAWDPVTGHHSPLYPGPWESGDQRYLNVDWAAKYWVQKGFPKENLVIGVPFFGRTFTLRDGSSQIRAAIAGPGAAGRFTGARGALSYYEVCEYLIENGTAKKWLEPMQVPYIVKDDVEWIGYDDPLSLSTKVAYITSNAYGGVMIWSVGLDDFGGQFCGQGKYPLLRAVRRTCGLVT